MTSSYRDQVQFPTSSEEESASSSSSSSGEEPHVVLDVLSSPSSDYLVQSFLGEGVFGRVAKCVKAATRETVAVKIIKKRHFTPQTHNEVAILQQLRAFDSDRFNFVKCSDAFIDREHVCLEFELLDVSLMEYLERKPSRSLSVKEIRPILHQMATTLQLLSSLGAVHADLKTDNIMMVDCKNQPLRVKMIDFGLAHHVSQSWGNSYIQPRYYRSPEVILGLPYTAAIDMWSLGCIAAELFLGHLLYPGNCEYDMLQHMVQTQGQLPQHLLNKGPKTTWFFHRERRRGRWWRLKTPREYGKTYIPESYFNSLDDLKKIRPECHLSDEDTMAEIEDLENFVDLLKKMLHLDVSKRITPSQHLEDPFITMSDVADSYPDSFYVKLCFELMEVCQDQHLGSDIRDRQLWLNPQASTSTSAKTAKTTSTCNVTTRNTSTTKTTDQHVSCSIPPAWHNHQEHPLVLEITSAVSSCLSIHEDQRPSEQEELNASGHEDKIQPELQLSVASEQSQSFTVKRVRKRPRDSFEASWSGDISPASAMPEKKRMKMDMDFFKTSQVIVQNSSEASSEAQTTRPQRKRTKAAFTAAHGQQSYLKNPKRLHLRSHPAWPKRRKRTWAAFVASHGEMRTSGGGSPETRGSGSD